MREYGLRSRSAAGSCNPDLMKEVFQPAIDGVIEMRQSISEDQAAGITRWNFDDPYGKQRISEFERWNEELKPTSEAYEEANLAIDACINSRGYGRDRMSLQGAINWTNDRISEYRVYLPRLWCDEEVHSWMSANYTEAMRIFPKLDEAILSGIKYYYEYSPHSRPMYLEYKNLEAMHQDVYDDEGHVFRSAADRCDKMVRPPQTLAGAGMDISKEDLWSAINALDEVTWAHETNWYKRLLNAAKAASDAEK